jgi:hypothetical protein
MKNYMVTLERSEEQTSAILAKTYSENFRRVERIEWQPHHVVFFSADGPVIAIRADRITEIVSYED